MPVYASEPERRTNLSAFCCCAALAALSTLSTAIAATGGDCTCRDARLSLVDGYSYRAPSNFGDDAEAETRMLTTVELAGTTAVASEPASDEPLFNREVGQLELALGDDGVVSVYANFPRGQMISRSGIAFDDLRLSRNDAASVTGRFTLAPDGTDDFGCDVNFDLSYIAASKAVLANGAAQRKTDVSARFSRF